MWFFCKGSWTCKWIISYLWDLGGEETSSCMFWLFVIEWYYFKFNKFNYVRCIRIHLFDLMTVEKMYPNIYENLFKRATKLYVTHYSWLSLFYLIRVIKYKSLFPTYSFGKLVFCLSALFVFSVCYKFDAIFISFCNIFIIIIYIAVVRYSVFLLSVITSNLNNLW